MTLGGRLTLSLGVRYDHMQREQPGSRPDIDNQLEETGETINGLGDMFTWKVAAPRVGFNYKLTDARQDHRPRTLRSGLPERSSSATSVSCIPGCPRSR